jgi:hypothetical protein
MMVTPPIGEDCAIRSVFIVEPANQGWIIERLMRDIAAALVEQGIAARIGHASNYAGEDVIFNSRYLEPFRDPRAQVNSLFVTHIDDRLRERELRRTFGSFDSYVCLSPHDAEFVAGLKGDSQGVIGLELPPRDLTVRPARLGLFSACYADGRKNQKWITDYFRSPPDARRASFILVFLGDGWEKFSRDMAAQDLNYEIYRYSRNLPGEYQLYKEVLPSLDALIYLGFDGGAMSVYDGVGAGIDLILTNQSFHRGLDDSATLVDNRDDFFAVMDRLHARVANRRAMLDARSVDNYVDHLLVHWEALLKSNPVEHSRPREPRMVSQVSVVQEFRSRYKPLGYSRLRSALIRFWRVRLGGS